jgi:inositol phosphorylceramide synthase catalytic subunit
MRNLPTLAFLSLSYFAWFYGLVGLRTEHVTMYCIIVGCYFAHPTTRRFIYAFGVFAVYWILYDSMRVLPNYEVNPIHIQEPYLIEKTWFGLKNMASNDIPKTFGTEGSLQTWNEYFKLNTSPTLDFLTGFAYLNWVPIPLLFAFYLFLKEKRLFLKFSYAFLFTNIIGFCIYYAYPAAPPWYVEQYGFQVIHGTPGNAAGLLNFDKLTGTTIFADLYKKNSSVFGAMPSLHSAYPLLCLLYGWRLKSSLLNVFFTIFVVGIWFAAVYTRHHYIIDVLAGASTALLGYFSFEYLSEKTRLKGWFDRLEKRI